jgi:hypothetical protein
MAISTKTVNGTDHNRLLRYELDPSCAVTHDLNAHLVLNKSC